MKLQDYQKAALLTALPDAKNLNYLGLGLGAEAGEVQGKLAKHIRDKTELDREALGDELGDVLWFAAVLADLLGLNLNEVAVANLNKLQNRQARNKIQGSGDLR